ncbi:MAG: carboxylate--amine ligase [Nitrospiraceae bacterium]|nr:carboxylate--amine ligase [Nitrospiraceae bacterium]
MHDVQQLIEQALARGQGALSEHDSKRVLAAFGVPTVMEELAGSAADAVQAAERLAYPVAVKGCSPDLMHKSDRGLVALDARDAAAVEAAVAAIDEAAGGVGLDGYLVQRMVRGKREIIVGGMRDALFGPCVMLGLGGILVEAVADVSFRLAPLGTRDALEMIGELRGRRIFGPLRGEPAADCDALAGVLMSVGRILEECPQVSQVDVNPLIFQGGDPVAVDGLVALAAPGGAKGGPQA